MGDVTPIVSSESVGKGICLMNKCTKRFLFFICSVAVAAGAGEVISPIIGGIAYEAKMERCVDAAKAHQIGTSSNRMHNCMKGLYINKFEY